MNLHSYNTTRSSAYLYRTDILQQLRKDLIKLKSVDEIIFKILQVTSPANEKLNDNPNSIEEAAGVILKHFGFNDIPLVTTKNLTSGKVSSNQNERDLSNIEKLNLYIIQLKKSPRSDYKILKSHAEEHLAKMLKLIDYYLNLDYIKKFKNLNELPKSIVERTYLDFYLRCNDELKEIVKFIHEGGLFKRALLKSTDHNSLFPSYLILGFNDFPYESAINYNISKFDHRLIGASHRVDYLPIKKANQMEKLYFEDKYQFYETYLKNRPIDQINSNIKQNISSIPLSPLRKEILKEIISLFENKSWIAFYGLAISQIEGMFYEMHDLVEEKSKPRNLSKKVNSLRKYYNLSSSYFDYFEYKIPLLRNKFMHGVLDGSESKRVNCYDFLTDLDFLLETTKKLNSPYLQISDILNSKEPTISSLSEINLVIRLYKDLGNNRKKEVRPILLEFVRECLLKSSVLSYIIKVELEEIEKHLSKLLNDLQDCLPQELDLKNCNLNDLNLKKDEIISNEEIKIWLEVNKKEINSICDLGFFINNRKLIVEKSEKAIEDILDNDVSPYFNLIKKVEYFASLFPELLEE